VTHDFAHRVQPAVDVLVGMIASTSGTAPVPASARRWKGSPVTDGFALGFGWLELLVLVGVLGYFLLRRRR
jgi:hypothetical protein